MAKSVIIDGIKYVPKEKKQPLYIKEVTIKYEDCYRELGYPSYSFPVSCELIISDREGNDYITPINQQLANLLIRAVHYDE